MKKNRAVSRCFNPRVITPAADIISEEMTRIGADPAGIKIMRKKGQFFAVKILGVGTVAANILKQEVLSRGGEAAVSYGTVNWSERATDVLVTGNRRMFEELFKKLALHQFGLPCLSGQIKIALDNYCGFPAAIKIGSRRFDFKKRAYIMGILNVTPDSFSDGGKFLEIGAAVAQALQMQSAGADLIDVGGESTRPGSEPVSVKEEICRVVPVIRALKKVLRIPVSIDTYKAAVADAALIAGAAMVNDISGLRFDKKMARVVAQAKVPVCVMHILGRPKNMQKNPAYRDLISEIYGALKESVAIGESAGILGEKIIVDPGLGFGKQVADNFEILRRLKEFKGLGQPILAGPSRKSFIGAVLNLPPAERDAGTVAAVAAAVFGGANIIRVHAVGLMRQVIKVAERIGTA
ncbi:MAG: dihydropteroate synthase [Candidatus Margulisiibacteriota bacterium]